MYRVFIGWIIESVIRLKIHRIGILESTSYCRFTTFSS